MTTQAVMSGSTRSIIAQGKVLSQEDVLEAITLHRTATQEIQTLLTQEDPLTSEQSRRLRRAQITANTEGEKIVLSMVKLVEVISREMLDRRFGKGGYEDSMHEDMVSEGAACVMSAALNFDPDRGPSFGTWAANVVRNHIRALVMDGTHTSVRVPNSWSRMRRVALTQSSEMSASLGRPPTTAELRERMMEVCLQWGLDHLPESMDSASPAARKEAALNKLRKQGMLAALRELDSVLITGMAPVQLDSPLRQEAGSTLSDLLEDGEAHTGMVRDVEAGALREVLDDALSAFPARDREIVFLRWGMTGGEVRTFKDIGQEFGVTAERVRQVEEDVRKSILSDRALASRLLSFLHPDLDNEALTSYLDRVRDSEALAV